MSWKSSLNVLRAGAWSGALMMAASSAEAVVLTSPPQTLNFSGSFSAAGGINSTMTVTGGSQTLSFTQFDDQNGRFILQSVNFAWAPTITSTLTMTRNSGNNSTATVGYSLDSVLNISGGGAPFPLATAFTTTVGPATYTTSNPINATINGSQSTSFIAANLAPFIGTGLMNVTNSITNVANTLTINSGGQGSNSPSVGASSFGGQLIITYTFLDTIPEPGSWAMLIAGFGLVGAAMRRRRGAGLRVQGA